MGMSDTADVVVVGLGAFGSAVLYQLAKLGVRVIGVDRFDPPHTMGSSHGETRITRLAVGEGDAYAPVVRRSHAIWRELEAESGETLMRQTGGLIMAPNGSAARHHGKENFVHRSFTVADRFAIDHERLEADEIARRYPQFQLRGDELGYFEPTAGMLTPEACVSVQLRLARARGAIVRTNEHVLEITQEAGGVRVSTEQGTIHAGRAVLTVGPWLRKLVASPLRPMVRPYRQVLHWFQPEQPAMFAVGRFPIFIWMHGEREEDYFYGFPMPEGAAGVKVATESYKNDVDADLVDRLVSEAESASMFAEHVHGRLRGVTPQVVNASACLYTVTPDSGFIIDKMPDQDLVMAISCCSGHGFKHSAAIGEAVAQTLAGTQVQIDLSPFSLDRLRIPTMSDSDSNGRRTLIPTQAGR